MTQRPRSSPTLPISQVSSLFALYIFLEILFLLDLRRECNSSAFLILFLFSQQKIYIYIYILILQQCFIAMSMQKKFKDVYNDSLINFTKVSRIFKYRLKKKLLFPFIFIFRQIQNSKVIQHS